MMFLRNLCTLYRERQNSGPKNDHAMLKSPGKSFWVRALVFNCAKEPLQNCTKMNLQRNQTKCFIMRGFRIKLFYALINRKQKCRSKNGHVCGNLLEIVFALGLWYPYCAKNTLSSCTK
jgi:hypothetical protein